VSEKNGQKIEILVKIDFDQKEITKIQKFKTRKKFRTFL